MLLLVKKLSVLALLTTTVAAVNTCESDPTCQQVICQIFDDLCDDQLCEQLDVSPWYRCHDPNEVSHSGCDICGPHADCHEVQNFDGPGTTVFCTCDDIVIDPGMICHEIDIENIEAACTRSCHESATCTAAHGTQNYFCLCDDGHIVEDGVECPGWVMGMGSDSIDYTSDNFDCATCGTDKLCLMDEEGEMGCFCNDKFVHSSYPCTPNVRAL